MSTTISTLIWQQHGAAIDMLRNAIEACPDDQWGGQSNFWYLAFHTSFWNDYYLSDTPMEKDYRPPHPFTQSEFQDGVRPDRVYSKEEVIGLLEHGRQRLRSHLQQSSDEYLFDNRFVSEYVDFSLFELLLYNLRHVQHHAAQLNMLLRQGGSVPPDWVSRTEEVI